MTLESAFSDTSTIVKAQPESTEWKSHFNHGLNAVFGVGLKAVGLATAGAMVTVAGPSAALAAGLVFGATHVIGSLTKAQYEFEAREDAQVANPHLKRPDFVSIAVAKLADPF